MPSLREQGKDVIRDPYPASRRAVLGIMATAPLAPGSTLQASPPLPARISGPPQEGAGVTPEQFGAAGDGTADDAPAIQRAMDAVAARAGGGTVVLQPRIAYRCGSGLVLDATRVSLWGHALLDFAQVEGSCLRVVASSVAGPGEPANNYGHKGTISGAIRIRGAGSAGRSIGIDFDSPVVATSAQMLVENMAVSRCGTGIRFGNRAYNNLLVRCEVFECGTCIDWPEAQDNGERNTLVGCTLYNSAVAVRVALSSASLQLQGCSLDYTQQLYDVRRGSVLAISCHHESDRWQDRPVRCAGDGALVRLDGGWILNQAAVWPARHFAEVGDGGTVRLIGMIAHNLALTPPDPSRVSAWATGEGMFVIEDTQSLELSVLPARVHAGRSRISDPDFRSATWEDMVWRIRDTAMPIVDRYGRDADNLRLAKGIVGGEGVLRAAKAHGSTSAAAFVLIAMPVSPGDQVLAGCRIRRDPQRPGTDGTVFVSPTWMRIDGRDERDIPRIVRSQAVGTLTVTPPVDRFLPIAPLHARTGRTAPHWATHFCMVVDLAKAHQASFLFNALWGDTI